MEAVDWPGVCPYTLSFNSSTGLDIQYNGDVLVATGNLRALNDALNGDPNAASGDEGYLKLAPKAGFEDFYGEITLTVTLHDQGNVGGGDLTAQKNVSFMVEPVNDQPELVGSFDPYVIDEGDGSLDITPAGGFSITDNSDWEWYVGSAGDLTYRVEFHADYCDDANVHPFEISFVSGPELTYDSTTGVWWLEAAVDDLNDYLADGFNLTLADGFEDYNGVTFLYLTWPLMTWATWEAIH